MEDWKSEQRILMADINSMLPSCYLFNHIIPIPMKAGLLFKLACMMIAAVVLLVHRFKRILN